MQRRHQAVSRSMASQFPNICFSRAASLGQAFRASHCATIVSDDQLPSELLLEQDRGRIDKPQTFNEREIASATLLGMRKERSIERRRALGFGSGRVCPGK
jgi:hypothetical protein